MSDWQCPRRTGEMGPWNYDEHDTWRDDDTCSFCGSLSPDGFFQAVADGKMITGTDKSYKVYVEPNRKFYFQHLDEDGQRRFIELHNNRDINYEPEFGLYTKPFFVKR